MIKIFNLILLLSILLFSCNLSPHSGNNGINIYGYNGNHKFIKVPVPEGGINFPIGYYDNDTAFISNAFYIGETQVTLSMYFTVAKWAQENKGYKNLIINYEEYIGNIENDSVVNYPGYASWYSIGNIYKDSGEIEKDYPISGIPYTGAIVWCNAYTEWYNNKYKTNYTPAYIDNNGEPIRNALVPFLPSYSGWGFNPLPCISYLFWDAYNTYHDYVVKQEGAEKYFNNFSTIGNGFRLPTANEWELAARWSNDIANVVPETINGIDFYVQKQKFKCGNSASGAEGAVFISSDGDINRVTDQYAVYYYNSSDLEVPKTKKPNALDIYDMSGNLRELVYNVEFIQINEIDVWGKQTGQKVPWPFAMSRGGSYLDSDPIALAVGYPIYVDATAFNYFYGFRIARNSD